MDLLLLLLKILKRYQMVFSILILEQMHLNSVLSFLVNIILLQKELKLQEII